MLYSLKNPIPNVAIMVQRVVPLIVMHPPLLRFANATLACEKTTLFTVALWKCLAMDRHKLAHMAYGIRYVAQER